MSQARIRLNFIDAIHMKRSDARSFNEGNARRKLAVVIGTRPEAIKMAPVILALRGEPWVELRVIATAQHREMLDQVLPLFGIKPDIDLDIMRPDQSLTDLTASLLTSLGGILDERTPDLVLAQGDTTTVMAAALASFYRHIPFGHVEAGLRTGKMCSPFPEEANRLITTRLARWHFAPTERARANLLRDGVDDSAIFVTGNTVIDALLMMARREPELGIELDPSRRLVLVTAHRRENIGAPLEVICAALRQLAGKNADTLFLYPLHANPNVRRIAKRMLTGCENVYLCEPLDYAEFVAALKRAYFVLSDSGGVQEEAPALGKPVLVLRNETERPEAVELGLAKLVGTDQHRIVAAAQRILDDQECWRAMAQGISPYGDGNAAGRIVTHLRRCLAAPSGASARSAVK
jgi:UDP-N-acetylglucosamine 2-epimerase (non-hydrolysing)